MREIHSLLFIVVIPMLAVAYGHKGEMIVFVTEALS